MDQMAHMAQMGGMGMEQMVGSMAMVSGMFNQEQAHVPMGFNGGRDDNAGKGYKGFKGDKDGKGGKGKKGAKGKPDAQEAEADFAAKLAAFRSKNNMAGASSRQWT